MREDVEPGAVTVAVPVYRRLHYLPGALESVGAQDYPAVDLLVSDNGENGPEVRELVERHYDGPYRFRRNPSTVDITSHYNQLVEAAEGEYFVLLADDDELGPGYLRRTVAPLEEDRDVGFSLAALEMMDEEGRTVPREPGTPPPSRMSGTEFVRLWCRNAYDFVCFCTITARTAEVREVGAYPVFPKGTSVDNALVLRLGLGRTVAFVPEATFRYRVYEESHGLSLPPEELAADLRAFLEFLDTDETLRRFAAEHPEAWREVRGLLREMTWRTYRSRWRSLYRDRLSTVEWIRSAFYMPPIPAYYRAVLEHLARQAYRGTKRRVLAGAAGDSG